MTHLGVVQFLLNIFGLVVTTWWLWLPIGATLGFLAWQNYRRTKFAMKADYQLMSFVLPEHIADSSDAADKLFASLHDILRPRKEILKDGVIQEHISFEIAVLSRQTFYFLWVPKHLQEFVQAQVAAQYPEARLVEVANDYTNRKFPQEYGYTAMLKPKNPDVLPLKTYRTFDGVNSLRSVQSVLTQLETDEEEYWIQILARPIDNRWHKRSADAIIKIRNNKSIGSRPKNWLSFVSQLVKALVRPPDTPGLTPTDANQQQKIAAIEEKGAKLGFETKIRLAYLGNDQGVAETRMEALTGAFGQFTRAGSNGLKAAGKSFDTSNIREYRARYFAGKGFVLNTEELATLWHLPQTASNEQVRSTQLQDNQNLATLDNTPEEELCLIGSTASVDGSSIQFGLTRDVRKNHVLVSGQTGSGKTGLLTLLALSDVYHHQGLAMFDPNGDYSQQTLKHIPSERIEQCVYLNMADTRHPVAFNPLQIDDQSQKPLVVNVLTEAITGACGLTDTRSEYVLRYSLLALCDHPEGTLLDIEYLLTSQPFREEVMDYVTDPAVRSFWIAEFAGWDADFRDELVYQLTASLTPVLSDPNLSMIVGQPRSSFKARQLILQGGILMVNGGGSLVDASSFNIVAQSLLAHLGAAAESLHTSSNSRPFYIYLDAAEHYILPSLHFLLEEPQLPTNITVSLAHDSSLSDETRTSLATSTHTNILFTPETGSRIILDLASGLDVQHLYDLEPRHFTLLAGPQVVYDATTLSVPPPEEDLSRVIIDNSQHVFGTPIEDVKKHQRTKQRLLSELKANIDSETTEPDNRGLEAAPMAPTPATGTREHLVENQVIKLR